MTRVVVDTNVIVSALLQPLGLPARIFVLAIGGSIQLCVSADMYAEYEEVIRRPRFRLDERVIIATLSVVREKGLWVKPTQTIRACSDPDDDVFFECAVAASAEYIVTGNLRHFPQPEAGSGGPDVAIVTPRQFLEILSGDMARSPA